ncbi:MAG: hypothetical protein ACOC1F_01290, partial [Myxococcota bacterium]
MLRLDGSSTVGAKLAPRIAEAFLKSLGATGVASKPGEHGSIVEARYKGKDIAIRVSYSGSGEAFTVGTEDYALSRRIYLYTPQKKSTWADKYVEFALSDDGQRVVSEVGVVSQSVKSVSHTVPSNAPKEYVRIVTGAKRLSFNFRFTSVPPSATAKRSATWSGWHATCAQRGKGHAGAARVCGQPWFGCRG